MAVVRIANENRVLKNPKEIAEFLSPHGIFYEQWSVANRLKTGASPEEILTAYAEEVRALQQRGGYITSDVIDVTPDVPNLQEMLDRFNREHTHSEDEVRFIIEGRGIFHVNSEQGTVFSIEVEAGDLINVPAGTKHWFDLCSDRRIRAIRLFREKEGWTPAYTESGIAAFHQPLCFGPNYLPPKTRIAALSLSA